MLNIATSQFPVKADIGSNKKYVLEHMRQAKEAGAHVVHFPEGALSGYATTDFKSFVGFDWDLLKASSLEIQEQARELGLFVLLGSAHPLTRKCKPHNSVYVLDSSGEILDRYDKRFCTGDRAGRIGELAHFSPGDYACVFKVQGIRCGVLICHEYRYPELFRDYRRRGVDVLFHSFHAANVDAGQLGLMKAEVGPKNQRLNHGSTYPEIIMPAAMTAVAASSHMWVSASNSSASHSCFPAFFVRADGVVTGRLRRDVAGVLMSVVDPKQDLYDSTSQWRDRALEGVLHSGSVPDDPRSTDRNSF